MKTIINFNNESELNNYLLKRNITSKSTIGGNSEGKCYKSNIDNQVYKLVDDEVLEENVEEYNIENIITEKNLYLESFLFPKEIITINNKFKGYTSRYVDNDLFNSDKIRYNMPKINPNELFKAYEKIFKDIVVLSNHHILIYDLTSNLLFSGKRLYAIDTIGYYKNDNLTPQEILKKNISRLNNAIKQVFIEYSKLYKIKVDNKDNVCIINYVSEATKKIKSIRR